MDGPNHLSRRRWLGAAAASPFLLRAALGTDAGGDDAPKAVAAVVTEYRPDSHADVIVSRILEGWRIDGGPGPKLRLASLYVDQPETSALGLELAAKYGVPVVPSIGDAITLGTDRAMVDGVLSIGEHGDYPVNAIGQQLYPRRRFFDEAADTFRKFGRVVPIFSDKHLGPRWDDALAMYDRAKAEGIPLMAGSSLPVSYRTPDLSIPIGAALEAALAIGYGPLDAYGFHGLEALQAFVERREGGEAGVRRVRALDGRETLDAIAAEDIPPDLLREALAAVPLREARDWRGHLRPDAGTFRIEYRDGFRADLLMLSGVALGFGVAVRTADRPEPAAAEIELRTEPRYPHFAFLLHAVERMIRTGSPAYPVERTLLTAGMLDRLLTSRAEGGRWIEAPELAISYEPADYPHAPWPPILG